MHRHSATAKTAIVNGCPRSLCHKRGSAVRTMIESKQNISKEEEEEIKRKAVEEYLAAQKAAEQAAAEAGGQAAATPEAAPEGTNAE